jgi:hypothetical protein
MRGGQNALDRGGALGTDQILNLREDLTARASAPKNSPAMEMTSTRIGASENSM